MGHVRLEVADRSGQVTAGTEEAMASCDGQDLVWTCKTVKWDGSARVTMAAIMDPYGMRQSVLELCLGDQPEQPATAKPRTGQRHIRFHPPRRPATNTDSAG
jgi:hypothetical protein